VPDDVVLVADGGPATELESRGQRLVRLAVSARLLLELETVPEAFAVAAGAPEVVAVGVKCRAG
jgi:S-methylmethionine-dependent homocysteine/selenocysteine methylase